MKRFIIVFSCLFLIACVPAQEKRIAVSDDQIIPITVPFQPAYKPCKFKTFLHVASPEFKMKQWFRSEIVRKDNGFLLTMIIDKLILDDTTLESDVPIFEIRQVIDKHGTMLKENITSPFFADKGMPTEIWTRMAKDIDPGIANGALPTEPVKTGDYWIKMPEYNSGFKIKGTRYYKGRKVIAAIFDEILDPDNEQIITSGHCFIDFDTSTVLEMIIKSIDNGKEISRAEIIQTIL